jgi:hypothetical protein
MSQKKFSSGTKILESLVARPLAGPKKPKVPGQSRLDGKGVPYWIVTESWSISFHQVWGAQAFSPVRLLSNDWPVPPIFKKYGKGRNAFFIDPIAPSVSSTPMHGPRWRPSHCPGSSARLTGPLFLSNLSFDFISFLFRFGVDFVSYLQHGMASVRPIHH